MVFWWIVLRVLSSLVSFPFKSICLNMFKAESSRWEPRADFEGSSTEYASFLCRNINKISDLGSIYFNQNLTYIPSVYIPLEYNRLTVMPSRNKLILIKPSQAHKRQHRSSNRDDRLRRLLRCTWVDQRNTRIMGRKGKNISARGESHAMDPSS